MSDEPNSDRTPHGTNSGYSYHGCRCEACGAAHREYCRAYNEANRERLKKYRHDRNKVTRPQKNAARAAWREANREAYNESQRQRHAKDPARRNAYTRASYAAHREAYLARSKKLLARRRDILRRYKAMVGCKLCGVREPVARLHFHHRDPSTKSFNIAMSIKRPWATVKAECRKCDVLCIHCHARLHIEMKREVAVA